MVKKKLPGEIVGDRYEIIEQIGSGGMARIYLVRDLEKQTDIAMKILDPPAFESIVLSKFQREFQTLRKITHPNIVAVYDFGQSPENPYYTMEYVRGRQLHLFDLKSDFERFLKIFVTLTQTLDFIHAKGLVHGDIKPQNVIISEPGDDLTLTDFGMAEEISLSRVSPVQGTLNYMSPENIRGSRIDQRSDIYSLGVMAYELLTGTLPFDAADPVTILRQHLEHAPPAVTELNSECPKFLSGMVMKCLEKRPLDRFQSADEIIRDIARQHPDLVEYESITQRESYILTSEFVGRKKELNYVIQNLELSLGGNGQTLFIGGETGIGKSRLLTEFKIHCQLEGYLVLEARCDEKESRPHQTMVKLCQQLLAVANRKQKKIVRKYSSELKKLSPNLSIDESVKPADQPKPEFDPSIERTRFYDALTQLFIDVSRTNPLVLLIEDLHWIDDVTLGILQYLIRNLGKAYIMICGTYLTEVLYSSSLMGTKDPLESMIEENASNVNFHELILEALKPGDVASMVGSMLGMAFKPEEFGKALYEETNGNPFVISEIMKQLIRENVIFRDKGEWVIDVDDLSSSSIPLSVKDIYQKRLELLSSEALNFLDYLSIPQKQVDFSVLAQFSSIPEKDLFEAVYELQNLELIESVHNSYFIANPRIREVIYSSISPRKKVQLHARYAYLLEKQTQDPEEIVNELAFHFVKGNEAEKALTYSVLAAEISERVYAHEQAADHYQRAERLCDQENVEQKSGYLKKLVDLSMMTGNYRQALAKLEDLFRLTEEHKLFTREEICSLNRKMAGIYQKMGEYHKALKFLYDGLALIDAEKDSFVRAQVHTNLGNIYMFLGDYDKALAHCRISHEIVEPIGNLRELSEIYNTYGKVYVRQRSLKKALLYFTKSLQLREKIGDTLGIGRTFSNLGVISSEMRASQEAEDYYRSGLKIFEKIGFIYGCATIYNNLGILYHQRRTDWERAISYLTKANELHERTGNEFGVAMTCVNLGYIFNDIADYEQAESNFNRAEDIYEKLNNDNMLLTVRLKMVSLLHDQGKEPEAYTQLLDCQREIETTSADDDLMISVWIEMARHFLLIKDFNKALDCCHRGILLAKKYQDLESVGHIKLLEAEILGLKTDSKQQEQALLEAISILEREGAIFLLGKAYWGLGSLYHESGQDQQALEFIEKARDIFQKIGVRSYFEVAQDLLARMRERVLPDLFKLQGDQGDIATLYRVSHDIISTLDLPSLLEKILDSAIKTVKAERGLLILYDQSSKKFDVKAARNMDRKTHDDMATVSGGVVERTVSQGIPIISTDATVDPRFKENQSVILFNIKSILCVPLKIKEKVIGALYLDNRALTNQFTEKDLDFLVVLANQAAISIDNALLYERFRSATDNLNVGMIVMENNGFIVTCNTKTLSMLNLTDDVIGSHFPGQSSSPLPHEIGSLMMKSLTSGEVFEREIKLVLNNNETKIVNLSTSLIFDGFGECSGVLCIIRDVTIYKILQEELDMQKRLNAIGDLATKIAHRMKSYLAGIKVLNQELQKVCGDNELKSEYISEILLEVAEAERYVLNELSPQKVSESGMVPVLINLVMQEVISANKKECEQKSIEIVISFDPDIPDIPGNPVQIREVFNNLFINAIQAVPPERGTIEVKTEIRDHTVIITLQDNGPGIPEDVKEKIFEPFFTTREMGSGVGLWVAHSVIKNAGGKIVVKSALGQGTAISVQLPVRNLDLAHGRV